MKPKIIIGVVIIIAALAYLLVSGFRESSVYYMTVSEVLEQKGEIQGQGLRVSGYVNPATIDWDAQAIRVSFTMVEGSDSLRVHYNGVKPDQLADAQQVLAEGKLAEDGSFNASKLLLKCPSKYETRLEQDQARRSY